MLFIFAENKQNLRFIIYFYIQRRMKYIVPLMIIRTYENHKLMQC